MAGAQQHWALCLLHVYNLVTSVVHFHCVSRPSLLGKKKKKKRKKKKGLAMASSRHNTLRNTSTANLKIRKLVELPTMKLLGYSKGADTV